VGQLGLNLATYPAAGILKVNPLVGVIHDAIRQILIDWTRDDGWRTEDKSTIGGPIGYVMPNRKFVMWDFSVGQRIDRPLDNLTTAIRKWGLPWIRKMADPAKLLQAFEQEQRGVAHMRPFVLPVLLLQAHRDSEAVSFVESELERIRPIPCWDTAYYERFVHAVKRAALS